PDRDRLVAAGRAVFSGDAAAAVDRLVRHSGLAVASPAGSPTPRLLPQAGTPPPPVAVTSPAGSPTPRLLPQAGTPAPPVAVTSPAGSPTPRLLPQAGTPAPPVAVAPA